MAGTFNLKQSPNGGFYFNLTAGNGQIILTSEHYESKTAAINGIDSVRQNADNDSFYERRTDTTGQPYFVLKAANGREIGRSESYSSKLALSNGIESVKTNAVQATTDETIS